MKKIKLSLFIVSMVLVTAISAQTTVSMGAGYADEIYYSMKNGVFASVDRAEWDLGFYTSPWSAGIITNGGSGIELRLYPNGDTAAWNAIDTAGLASWPILYNGEDSWENGAFNRNGSHPDYGWGIYNTQSHDVVGDSLYIIKLQDGSYKKLWIVKKISIENTYIFRYGNLDNTMEEERTLYNNDYTSMNFSYFNFASGSFFDREPAKDEWDILFTRYQAMQPQGVPYPVIGVLNNVGVKANRVYPVTLDFSDWYSQPFDSLKAVIGWDWKYFEMSTFTWALEDSLVFFVNSLEGDIYKIYFTDYAGTSTGEISFNDELVSLNSIGDESPEKASLLLSPNPAGDHVILNWNGIPTGETIINVVDISGKEVIHQTLNTVSDMQYRMDVSKLHAGMYIVNILSNDKIVNQKLVIR